MTKLIYNNFNIQNVSKDSTSAINPSLSWLVKFL